MSTIKAITNPNPLVEQKVNYFLDQVNHAMSYAGWQYHLELESPTSLLEKIIFRLKEDTEYRLKYLTTILSSHFLLKTLSGIITPLICL